jgi:predicted oxidoreductase
VQSLEVEATSEAPQKTAASGGAFTSTKQKMKTRFWFFICALVRSACSFDNFDNNTSNPQTWSCVAFCEIRRNDQQLHQLQKLLKLQERSEQQHEAVRGVAWATKSFECHHPSMHSAARAILV